VSLQVKRVYDKPSLKDGRRFLVERLWPRGVKRDAVRIDGWLKEVAPSDALRRWYAHDVVKWNEFRERYVEELDRNPEPVGLLLEAARHGPVTLVYSARDTDHNSALVLRQYLEKKARG